MLKIFEKENFRQTLVIIGSLILLVGLWIFNKSLDAPVGAVPTIVSKVLVGSGEPYEAGFTPSYINNATTTYEFNTEGADTVNLELFSSVASSTTDTVGLEVKFSDNGTNWFSEDVNSTAGSLTTHNTQPRIRAWTPGATASTTKNIQITGINSKYIQIGFASWGLNHTATSSQIAFWARYILNKPL